MSNSTNLALPFLTLGQAQKHVTVNESLLRLDALVQLSVVSALVSAEPGSPTDGQVYILPAGKTGTHWGAMTNNALAYYRDGVWEEIQPSDGWMAHVKDFNLLLYYNGSAWVQYTGPQAISFSATDKILGRISSGAGAAEEVAFTDQAQDLCDDTSFSAMRTTLSAAGTGDANVFTSQQTARAGVRIDANATTVAALSRTMVGLELSAAGTTVDQYFPPIKFMSRDGQLTTENPKLVATIAGRATQTYNDDGDGGAAIDFFTTPNDPGATSLPTLRMSLATGLVLGAPTGGDKGAGTLNATAVYDDNTLLTCFVLEYARTGALDLEFWDSAAPRGYHAAAHRFWGQRELLDVDAYTAYWKEFGHLPGLPAREEWAEHARDKKPVGEMISRLWQTVEMQAVHIAQLSDEIKRLRS
ncbi:MAG: DUF2793 domain-containing protein [Hyphomonadaceae bacterium]|nr:DUF2793 domain-containing protein [Hyphomonadaceae bacterium]